MPLSPSTQPGDPMLLGYALTGFGGVRGEHLAYVGPLGRMNFLVGRNNHGKSTVMRAAKAWVVSERRNTESQIGREPGQVRATLVPFQRADISDFVRHASYATPADRRTLVDQIVVPLDDDQERVGIWLKTTGGDLNNARNVALAVLTEAIGDPHRRASTSMLTPGPHVPNNAIIIPAFREMRVSGESVGTSDLASGENLVRQLDAWQHPQNPSTPAYVEAKARWSRLRDFLRDVLEDPNAELEVAGGRDLHVHLAQANTMLRIQDLGDGIKQVLMIAAACIHYEGCLILLEEPEIHLHAGLQRKLMGFLHEQTTSQYIVATHSAHVLDLPGARIFHITHDGTSTLVSSAVRASQVRKVCQDLGYMASDLLQANYTVWVEGPSDRIYWRRWLQLLDPDLQEGVHFAVMTYGGYLVDGMDIRGDEEDRDIDLDLIALLRLGRSCTLIADSDKKTADEAPRATLARLARESAVEGSGTLVVCEWVSTVENLIPRPVFRAAVNTLHPVAGKKLKTPATHGPFDNPFKGMKSYSKVKVARAVADELTLGHIDEKLREQVLALADRIRAANGLVAGSAATGAST
ncbi:ATP-binding protein [Nocardioides sp. 1609]|uniref:AAA family ATPase n=1 Tax=Nocardioides sp. 1609 TaxID=2508327 RepID=UPI0014320178|nr:ATP-binding protein [Nocardioides sp. 1609]